MGATLNPGATTGVDNLFPTGGYYDPATGQFMQPGQNGGPATPINIPGLPNNSGGAGVNNDPWNLPQFSGPYSAPLLQGQMDALQGFNQLFSPSPLLQTQDLNKAIQFAMSGGPLYHPNSGKTLQESTDQYKLPSGALDATQKVVANGLAPIAPTTTNVSQAQGLAANFAANGLQPTGANQTLNAAANFVNSPGNAGGSFDQTELFNNQGQVFQGDLNRELARIKEEMSGLGLGPGSTDRNDRLARTAGDSLARFRVGQLEQGQQAFENAAQRGLAARGQSISALNPMFAAEQTPFNQALQSRQQQMAGTDLLSGISQIPFQQQMSVAQNLLNPAADRQMQGIGLMSQLEEQPFNRMMALGEPAANRAMQALPSLFQLEQRPFDRFMQQFQLNEAARGVADQESLRRQAEFARTQGGALNQLLAILSGSPLPNTGFGPSWLSSIGSLAQGIGSIIPGL